MKHFCPNTHTLSLTLSPTLFLPLHMCVFVFMSVCVYMWTKTVQKTTSHIEYFKNQLYSLDVTWQPIGRKYAVNRPSCVTLYSENTSKIVQCGNITFQLMPCKILQQSVLFYSPKPTFLLKEERFRIKNMTSQLIIIRNVVIVACLKSGRCISREVV